MYGTGFSADKDHMQEHISEQAVNYSHHLMMLKHYRRERTTITTQNNWRRFKVTGKRLIVTHSDQTMKK